ncbi:MAG TPA: NADH-quinone oxidoreductase subunit NuoK [Chitinophagales bacterium]|nr:NADH-quinone oxidoreductase subunit NuoK [Chitinophagales bacterium]HMX03723.1 NADH-quinone oxidoreductase subunit NuoK [Chitinophagales bacterium]HMZ89127.1 NADH-quinone oxidoreductase subunit NuoK [Chitinophagales bacterium]HNA58195.1 NADH-quinone oxidoreductase subunit NuoK [Chitinophagales bacterium]HNE44550.1 NADH-quinone oxidoreductase subunit NuoK [Chitinophagales bacterium]
MDNTLSQQLQVIPLENYVMLSIILFSIGVIGILMRRNLIVVFLSIELMLNSINLMAASFSAYHNDPAGQAFVFFIMVVAAAEVAVGLAMLVMIYRNVRSIEIDALSRLKW